MRNKVYWGLGVLIVLFIGAFVLVMVNQYAENDQLEAEAEKAQQQADRNKQQKNVTDKPPSDEPISNPKMPIAHHDVPIIEVPTGNVQASEELDWFSKNEGKPIDEDFYREYMKVYSRERLKENMKSFERLIEQNRKGYISGLDKILKKKQEWLHEFPDCEYTRKRIAEIEADINFEQGVIKRMEGKIAMMSKVLDEEVSNDEK